MMRKQNRQHRWRLIALTLLAAFIAGCAGEDFTPVYFPPPEGSDDASPQASEGTGSRNCTLSFTSQLCVTIKGDEISVGADPGGEALCAEVPAFPIHVNGNTASIRGNEFPDVQAEGHGLPVPITINARGIGDGSSNVGEGPIDSTGNMTIDGFSLYIVALGVEAEIPNLTLTTGSTDELPHLPAATGSPPDASGAMTIVVGTVLGHTIDAADEFLMGASLTGTFTGSIQPTLSQCGGGDGEHSIEVKKIIVDASGAQTEARLPDDAQMKVSTGTFIAEASTDVGERFEASARFRVKNISSQPQHYQIPPRKGAFHLSSMDPLTGTLRPQQTLTLTVIFRPTLIDAEPGEVMETLSIGSDGFTLVGVALSQQGAGSVDVVDEAGSVTAPNVEDVEVGSAAVTANAERRFFHCQKKTCGEAELFTQCADCPDPSRTPCELLPVSTTGRPLSEVDDQCQPIEADAAPMLTIDLKGTGETALPARKQVLAIRNKGVEDLTITSVHIDELNESRSPQQFRVPDGAIFIADSFEAISSRVARALEGKGFQGTTLPITLPPYQPGYRETTAYVVVVYEPTDLVGHDGGQAGVGSAATDKAMLTIETESGPITTVVTGKTTITETPSLELYFKTSIGTKYVSNGRTFPFRGVTAATTDLGVPLFLRVADSAANTLRITAIAIDGEDADSFQWFDTKEKIAAVQPAEGKGMRCSVPIIDETSGEMIDEIFDLTPVSLAPPGFDMAPGAYSTETMPLFGCVNFHRDEGAPLKHLYRATIRIEALELDAQNVPARNPDGSTRKAELTGTLLAAIDPLRGHMVLRVTQTMAAILNPQFPGLSSIASRDEMESALANGTAKESDLQVFTSAFILDPFDEMTIMSIDGTEKVSTPDDGGTAIFRALDTHPVNDTYDDEAFFNYASLLHDAGLAPGERGIFDDFPNVPDGARANGWRIFTTTLSYPGPLAPPAERPAYPSSCEVVNPCSAEGLKVFTDEGAVNGRGACAFFYASGGRYDSPAFHTKEEMPGGEYENLCNRIGERQNLQDINTGHYSVDGSITFEEAGLRFFGPTYFHNPGGPLGPKPPLDAVFQMSFTTDVLKPQEDPEEPNTLPDTRIDLAKGEFKINLNDPQLEAAGMPGICENNTQNAMINGKRYSSWKYLQELLFRDAEATIPAGCPEDDNDFTGGSAYMRGRNVDPETGAVTFVTAGKFGSSDDLSFAFKDVMIFVVLNGWLCDPQGREEDFEGARCFDATFNERDAIGQISIMD